MEDYGLRQRHDLRFKTSQLNVNRGGLGVVGGGKGEEGCDDLK